MTQDEQNQLNHLQQELSKSHDETRFYQGIFWCALAIAVVVALFGLLQR